MKREGGSPTCSGFEVSDDSEVIAGPHAVDRLVEHAPAELTAMRGPWWSHRTST
jgi:hypothetical protein